jgi:hypothetical protein
MRKIVGILAVSAVVIAGSRDAHAQGMTVTNGTSCFGVSGADPRGGVSVSGSGSHLAGENGLVLANFGISNQSRHYANDVLCPVHVYGGGDINGVVMYFDKEEEPGMSCLLLLTDQEGFVTVSEGAAPQCSAPCSGLISWTNLTGSPRITGMIDCSMPPMVNSASWITLYTTW